MGQLGGELEKRFLKGSFEELGLNGPQDGSLGASGLRECGYHRWKWELRVPLPICKTRDWCTASKFSSTFLDVPSGAFPDSRPACIPNPNRFLLSYQVRARGTCDLLGQGCWQSLFSAPRLCSPSAALRPAGGPSCPNRIFPPISISLLGPAPLPLQMCPPSSLLSSDALPSLP